MKTVLMRNFVSIELSLASVKTAETPKTPKRTEAYIKNSGSYLLHNLSIPVKFYFKDVYAWLRLVETLRTSSEQYEDYEFDDLAATVKLYEPSLAFSFSSELL